MAFIIVFTSFYIGMKFNTFAAMITAMAGASIVLTDRCHSCGRILFYMEGNSWKDYLNPLYVPQECPVCGHFLDPPEK